MLKQPEVGVLVNSNPNPGLGLDEPTWNLQLQVPGWGSNQLQLFVVVTLFNSNPQLWPVGLQSSEQVQTWSFRTPVQEVRS